MCYGNINNELSLQKSASIAFKYSLPKNVIFVIIY